MASSASPGNIFYPRCRAILRILFETFDGGIDETIHSYDVIPESVEVSRNTLREADTFKMDIDFSDFPFDPRALRQVHVTIALGQRIDGNPAEDLRFSSSQQAFIGYVDEPKTSLQGSNEVVSLSGRDYTSLFLDHAWRAQDTINIASPLGLIIRRIMEKVTGAENMMLRFADDNSRFSVPSSVVGRDIFVPRGKKDDAWTILADICDIFGLLPVIEFDELVIKSAKEFNDQHPVFLYGENLLRLEYKKKFNENRTKQIRVVCWDEQANETREAIFPQNPIILEKKINSDGVTVSQVAANILPFTVFGSYSQNDLKAIAENIYRESAREQVEGMLETKDLLDLTFEGDDRSERDRLLTRLGNGDQLTVILGRGDEESIIGLPESEAVLKLTAGANGMDRGVARALVAAFNRVKNKSTTFYIKQAVHRWSRTQGYMLQCTFINLVGEGSESLGVQTSDG